MVVFCLLAGSLLVFAAYGVVGHLDSRVRKHGPHALAWRWFSASGNWTGKAITNRGWTRPGTKALTPTGHAHRRWYLPRWQHALWRTEHTLAAVLLAFGLLLQPRRTLDYVAVTMAAGLAYGSWRAWQALQEYGHRKNYIKPLHARLAALAGIPAANRPESWIEVPRDRSRATLTLPKGVALPSPEERKTIAATAAATLGMGNAKPAWQFTGPQVKLHLSLPVPAPVLVTLEDVREAILAAGVDDLILGIGQDGKVIRINLRQDHPHMALSVDTGGGKSVLVRCIVPQVLFRGGIAAVLDNKLVSHPSLRGLPNVAYCDDIDKIHNFLVWLDGELNRRAEFIRSHTDVYGNLTGSPGPRLFVIMEEQNLMMNRLRSYWADLLAEDRALPKEDRQFLPAVSPAIRGFENGSYVGRELNVHLCFIAQRFTAEAAGGGSKGAAVRMNTGIRILAGYDDDTWKMLVGKQTPMPPPSRHAGRMQVYVKGTDLTEVQIAFFTHAEAREFAQLGGTPDVPAKLRHLTVFTNPEPPEPADLPRDPSQQPVTVIAGTALPSAPLRNWMTIGQAREACVLPRTWTKPAGAFRTAKHRAAKAGLPVPEVKGMRGGAAMYDAIELADFLEQIITTRQAA